MQTGSWRRIVVLSVGATAAVATLYAADPLATLGVPAREANEQLMSVITAGNMPYGAGTRAFRKLSGEARGIVTADLFAWARATTSSPVFKTAYMTYRTSQKPEAPTFDGTVDQEFQKKQSEQAAQLAESRKSIASFPAEQRKAMEEALRTADTMMKNPQLVAAIRAGIAADRQSRQEGFTRETAEWQERYPENVQPLIAKQLRRFLEASANVDFAAKLTSRNGATIFADPQYEQKPSEWKMCYRAGKEAVSVARTAAAAWLKELGQ